MRTVFVQGRLVLSLDQSCIYRSSVSSWHRFGLGVKVGFLDNRGPVASGRRCPVTCVTQMYSQGLVSHNRLEPCPAADGYSCLPYIITRQDEICHVSWLPLRLCVCLSVCVCLCIINNLSEFVRSLASRVLDIS